MRVNLNLSVGGGEDNGNKNRKCLEQRCVGAVFFSYSGRSSNFMFNFDCF